MRTRAPAPSGSAAPRVTRPGDAAEREADRLAEDALRRTAASPLRPMVSAPAGTVMRQIGDERLEPEYEEDDGYDLAAKSRSSAVAAPPAGFLASVRSSTAGRPLEPSVRSRMERGFGHSLDGVRIHTDTASAALADSVNARAFTHERDVFFGRGEYAPGTEGGDRLLAHELAHTVQQAAPGRIARAPVDPALAPPKDPSRMTDPEKISFRTVLSERASVAVAALKDAFVKSPQLDGAETAQLATIKQALTDALTNARKITNQDQKAIRVAYLSTHLRLLDEPFGAWVRAKGGIVWTGGLQVVGYIGDPTKEATPEELDILRSDEAAARGGVEAYLHWLALGKAYAEAGVTTEQLATPESSAAETGGGGGTPPGGTPPGGTPPGGTPPPPPATGAFDPGTVEERQLLEEMHTALADLATEESPTYDQAKLLAELRKLDADARKDFYAFVRTMVEPAGADTSGATPKTLDDLLALFTKLDPASREALKINRKTAEADPTASEAMPESVRLKLASDVAKERSVDANAKKLQGALDQLRAKAMPADVAKELDGVDFGISPFLNESAMLYGLLAGGGERSPLVKQAGDELLTAVAGFREQIERELIEAIVEAAALTALSVATKAGWILFGRRLASLARTIKRLKQLADALQAAYATAERVKRLVGLIEQARDAYPELKAWYDRATVEYARFQRVLESEDAEETIEAALEAKEDELVEELDRMLEGKLGDILELLYIPDDASPEELRAILFDIPRGMTAFEDMWAYYGGRDKDKPHFADVLATKAYYAGGLLYPFVGFVSANIAEAVRGAFSGQTFNLSLNQRILGALSAPGRAKKTRSMFGRLNRKRYDIKPGQLDKPLAEAKTMLRDGISRREPGEGPSEHWSPTWFKRQVRAEIKTVNTAFRGRTVEATPKGKKGTPAAPAEQIPMPKFRVRLKRPGRSDTKLVAQLQVNPATPVEVDRLSINDFAGDGVDFTGDETRKEGIRKFLRDKEYEIVPHPVSGEYIRLEGGQIGTTAHPYLRIDAGKIKSEAAPPKDGYVPFLGRTITDDRDLPEGYHLAESTRGGNISVNVALKKHLAAKAHDQLGLDQSRKLVKGPGRGVASAVAPLELKPVAQEGYDYVKSVDTMLAPAKPGISPFKAQRTKQQWLDLMRTEPDLQKRPRAIEGKLGYTIRARALGDRLASRHVPELREEDDKGHLVARRFGSDPNDPYWNLVPMLRRKNQFPGDWFRLESEMAEVYVGKNATGNEHVKFGVSLIYPSAETRRPSKFVAKYQVFDAKGTSIGGGEKRKTVDND